MVIRDWLGLEVAFVLWDGNDSTHRTDIKTKKPPANDGDGGDGIDIANHGEEYVFSFCLRITQAKEEHRRRS